MSKRRDRQQQTCKYSRLCFEIACVRGEISGVRGCVIDQNRERERDCVRGEIMGYDGVEWGNHPQNIPKIMGFDHS